MTAVEWFNQQLVDRQHGNGDSRSRDEIFEQAKEMEEEQIVEAWYSAYGGDAHHRGEAYYIETFKTKSCCDNGIIICPGCDGDKKSEFGICAGCIGVGEVVCGKCNGLRKHRNGRYRTCNR